MAACATCQAVLRLGIPNANVIAVLVLQCVLPVATDIPSFATFIRDLARDYIAIGRAAPLGAGRRNVGVDVRIPLAGSLVWMLLVSKYREKEQSY